MADELSSGDANHTLRFPCSCVSAADVKDDPWTAISKGRKLQDGTKELILNAIHRSPRTIAQLAEELQLSQPTVHRHITELHASQLIREVTVPQDRRQFSVERYYAPNFPVIFTSDRREVLPLLELIAREVAEVFRRHQDEMAEAYANTSLPDRGEAFEQLLHWFYTAVIRMAREQLQEQRVLPTWPEHNDSSRWLWWAEEPLDHEAPRPPQV